jgi:hypothetical protein
MAEGAGELLSRLDEVVSRLEQLEARVASLEARGIRPRARAADEAGPAPAGDEALAVPALPSGTLALVGRTLLVLAGAYVVRALTDGQALPAAVGVAVGIAYAAALQLLADREAAAGRVQSAAFHDVASSLIAFPLLWEAVTRFRLLPAAAAAAALVAFFALGLAVAWRRRLVANAVVTTALALGTALALLVSTHDLLVGLASLLALAAGLEWLACRGAWLGLRWPAAAALDGVALLLVAVTARPELPEGYAPVPLAAAALLLVAIPALYIASVAARTLRLGQPVTVFEVVQGSVAVLLGFGGAVRVLRAHGLAATAPGALALLLGLLCYGAAFAYAERRPGQGRNFYFYTTAGGLLTIGGTALVGLGPALPLAWAAAGLAAALLGRRFDRTTLRVHGALLLAAAALQAGLFSACASSLGGAPGTVTPVAAWACAALAAAAWLVLVGDPAAARSGASRLPQLLLALVVVAAALQLAHAGAWASAGSWLAADAGVAAVVRTAVLAALALGLAVAARRRALPELAWLVYPLIVLGGLKLLAQDLRHGRPATLVLSLALYGLVLTLAPRLLKAEAGRP